MTLTWLFLILIRFVLIRKNKKILNYKRISNMNICERSSLCASRLFWSFVFFILHTSCFINFDWFNSSWRYSCSYAHVMKKKLDFVERWSLSFTVGCWRRRHATEELLNREGSNDRKQNRRLVNPYVYTKVHNQFNDECSEGGGIFF